MAIINDRIKNRRKALNLTLLEIAEYIGVKEATMQRYENGVIKTIPYDKVVLIAECLKCTPQYLMGWSDEYENKLTNDDELNEDKLAITNLLDKLNDEQLKAARNYLEYLIDRGNK